MSAEATDGRVPPYVDPTLSAGYAERVAERLAEYSAAAEKAHCADDMIDSATFLADLVPALLEGIRRRDALIQKAYDSLVLGTVTTADFGEGYPAADVDECRDILSPYANR